MQTISWDDFKQVDIRVGTIVQAEVSANTKKPALKIWVDLGELGIKKSSAQISHHYSCETLPGKQVVCVVNFPPKQIKDFMSEILVTGFEDEHGHIVLATPDKKVENGKRLF